MKRTHSIGYQPRCACLYILLCCLLAPGVALAQPAQDVPDETVSSMRTLRTLVRQNGDVRLIVEVGGSTRTAPRTRLSRLLSSRAVVNRTYVNQPLVAVTVDEADLELLARSSQIKRIYRNVTYRLALNNTTNIVGAPPVWNRGTTGAGRAVAIIDTGVDAQHPFLRNKVIAEACFSDAGPGALSLCPNGRATQIGNGAANPRTANCVDRFGSNVCSHGTHVAGIVAGRNGNDSRLGQFSGVAPGAKLVGVQVFHRTTNGALLAHLSDILAALDWLDSLEGKVRNTDLAAVNMSLSMGQYSTECDYLPFKNPIDRLLDDGVVTVISAGNGGQTGIVGAPGCISSAVTVAAVDDSDQPARFSNIGRLVDLWAPGVRVASSVVGNEYSSYDGTSMAAPHVAGAAAILEQYGFSGGVEVAAALTASPLTLCRGDNNGAPTRCAPRLDLSSALSGTPQISEEYVRDITATTAFVGFTSNICGYGDYAYSGGVFTAPRDGTCYNRHGITLGVDTPALFPNASYTVDLTLTDPDTGALDIQSITFATLPAAGRPEISDQNVSQITSTSAFVGFRSNICAYGDYFYSDDSFVAPRDGVCYTEHGITLGVDTKPLTPNTTYRVRLVITDPDTGDTDVDNLRFTTADVPAKPRILRPYVSDLTATSAFVGYTSNICGYGDYNYKGGSFVAPRNNICYTDHGITLGVDTRPLNPATTYKVRLVLTDPDSGTTGTRFVTFTTLGEPRRPKILKPYVTNITQTKAFVGYTSNICGHGDYRYAGGSFIAPRSFGCYVNHGITLGRDTPLLRRGTQYTVELSLTDPVTQLTTRRNITFTTEPSRRPDVPEPEPIALEIGEKNANLYGRGFRSAEHPDRVTFKFNGTGEPLLLTFRGFDIDTRAELSVTMNSFVVGRSALSKDRQLSRTNAIVIDANRTFFGENTLTFQQELQYDLDWGVSKVRLRPLYNDPIPLTIGVRDSGQYGYAYRGNSAHIGAVAFQFPATDTDLLFSVRGFDIDTKNEAKVYLNGVEIGRLRKGRNNALAPRNQFVLDQDQIQSSDNILRIVQKNPGSKYGVTDVSLMSIVEPSSQ